MKPTLSEFFNMLHDHYDYIDNDEGVPEYYNQQDFVCRFLSESVATPTNWGFLDKKAFLNKIYNGNEELPKIQAKYIDNNKAESNLCYFLNNRESEQLAAIATKFAKYIGVATDKNVAKKICNLFYEIVLEIKNKKATKKVAKPVYIDTTTTNEHLAKIIDALSSVTEEKLNGFANLRLDPQPVEDKIDERNVALKKDILNNVYDYFFYINSLIAEASKTNSAFGRKLTETIQNASDNFIKQGYSQEQVVTSLANHIKCLTFLTKMDDLYFRIIVAYFVQHCEVFYNETSK